MIDAHHHLWDTDLHPYPWLAATSSPIPRRYLLDDFLDDAAGSALVKSVHVQGEVARSHTLAESTWLQAIADQHGFPHGIVAYAPLQDPRLDEILAAHAQHANLRGIRQILNPDQCERPDYLTDPGWRAGYARLEDHGLSFDLQALPEQMTAAADLAAAHPGIPMVINHTGMPRDQSPDGRDRWRRGMSALSRHGHVSVKISGFGMFDPVWTVDSVRRLVHTTIDLFGVDRCMFASNFPVDRVFGTYAALFEAFDTLVTHLSAEDRQKLFEGNAERIYRL